MIIEIPDENSIVKWKYNDKDDWKVAEISDLIKAYERPKGDCQNYIHKYKCPVYSENPDNCKNCDRNGHYGGCEFYSKEKKMTNEKKFEEVFGVKPDRGICPIKWLQYCIKSGCKGLDGNSPCAATDWWDSDYKENKE